MDKIATGWFSEINDVLWNGQCMSLKVEKILFQEKSKYQDVCVFQSVAYGKVLTLDGVIQCTERDEFSYQEMISFLPLNSHPNPEKVLIIGGGDGGVSREVVKHPLVKQVVQCEIDETVIEVCKKYLPFMAAGFEHPKLKLHIGCGAEFMRNHQGEFDVIITDSSDPIGPAEALFKEEYYQQMSRALKPNGLLCTQGECMWLHLDLIKNMKKFCNTIFPVVDYASTSVPTYPSGQIGFIMCSKNKDTSFRDPATKFSEEDCRQMTLRYYNSRVHAAAFVLPQFAKEALES